MISERYALGLPEDVIIRTPREDGSCHHASTQALGIQEVVRTNAGRVIRFSPKAQRHYTYGSASLDARPYAPKQTTS